MSFPPHHQRNAPKKRFYASHCPPLIGITVALALIVGSANGANLIVNGSFEAGAGTGTDKFTGWTKENVPTNSPASVIVYNSTAAYPTSAFTEAVTPSNATSASPDAVGNYAAYFVGDLSVNETIFQYTYLTPGNYRLGFDWYLTQNGLGNPNNASISVQIIGVQVAATHIDNLSVAKVWDNENAVASITLAGYYKTSLVFNSNGTPAKDVVIDRVYAMPTTDV